MSDEQAVPDPKGPAPVRLTPEATAPVVVPASEVKPKDIGTLSIEYRDGRPVIVVSGGPFLPAHLPVVHDTLQTTARYTAAAADTVLDDGDANNLVADGGLVLGYQGWLAAASLARGD